MKTCKHCKRKVSGSHNCEVKRRTIDGFSLGDFLSDVLETVSSFGDSDSDSDFGGD